MPSPRTLREKLPLGRVSVFVHTYIPGDEAENADADSQQ